MVRFMHYNKVAIGTQDVIADHVRERTWQRCAFTCHAFMAATFVIGAKLGPWFDNLLQKSAIQSAQGQLLAVQMAIKQTPSGSSISQQCFTDLCTACGLWVWIRDTILPLLAIGAEAIVELGAELGTASGVGSLHAELLALRSREPSGELKDLAMCADWVLGNVGTLRAAKDAEAEKANRVARQNPALLLTQVESAQMATGVYIGQVTLDVNAYREASRLFGADDAKATAEFETLLKHHVMNVKAAQDYFQLGELVFDSGSDISPDTSGAGGKWLPPAVSKARANAQALARILKLAPGDIATVNIVAMNTIGTLKTQVLNKLQQELAHLEGVTLVIHPLAPRGYFQQDSPPARSGCAGCTRGRRYGCRQRQWRLRGRQRRRRGEGGRWRQDCRRRPS